jgi:hypothetical protein
LEVDLLAPIKVEKPQHSSHSLSHGATRRTHVSTKNKDSALHSKYFVADYLHAARVNHHCKFAMSILLVAHHAEAHDILLAKLHGHTKHSEHEVM